MPSWSENLTAITLFVDELAPCREFYIEVFGAPVIYEDEVSAVFDFGGIAVNLLQSSEAPELVEPLLIGAADAGPRMQLTITVDDVDDVVAKLAGLGVELLNGPIDRPWGIRTAALRDPAGHVWEIAR